MKSAWDEAGDFHAACALIFPVQQREKTGPGGQNQILAAGAGFFRLFRFRAFRHFSPEVSDRQIVSTRTRFIT